MGGPSELGARPFSQHDRKRLDGKHKHRKAKGFWAMSAFLILDAKEVHDEHTYAKYRADVPANLAAGGGTYLVRGGELEVLEGDWHPKRVVVIRFDSMEAARRWWSGSGYFELRAMRHRSVTSNLILVEGVPDA